jgi:glucose/arabinose dehydrogenase
MALRPIYVVALVGVLCAAAWVWQPWQPDRRHFFDVMSTVEAAPEGVATLSSAAAGIHPKIVAQDLKLPWDIAFLSDTEALVTEKAGAMYRVDLATGTKQAVAGMPSVRVQGQGGLHAVLLHPNFAENGLLYLSYAAPPPDGNGATTHFMRAKLSGTQLTDQKLLLQAKAPTGAGQHFGGAMAFDRDGYLFVSVGDRGTREDAQKLTSHNGKILRLHDDGRVPKDNPFVDTPGAMPEIWSYGHRNPQGLSFDPATGALYEAEHGPQGGDEINRIERGRNYGWPVITYGREYGTGFKIGEGTTRKDVPPPVHYYVPSIATAGIAYYAADLFPQWKHSVFVASLRGHLNRVQLTAEGRFVQEERLLTDAGLRVRAVRVSPKGEIYVVADDGVIVRLDKIR